jgi:biotin synthase-like enzyme
MLKNKRSFINNFIIAKNEFVSMKLHFRYHTYLSIKEGNIYEECRYCKDRFETDNGYVANENGSGKSEKGGGHFNADKK